MAFLTEAPNNGERNEAYEMAKRKLTGTKFQQAKGFIFDRRRSVADLRALITRLEPLPDVGVVPVDRTPVTGLSRAEQVQMQSERDAGAKLREIAEKHRVSLATVSRRTRPAGNDERGE